MILVVAGIRKEEASTKTPVVDKYPLFLPVCVIQNQPTASVSSSSSSSSGSIRVPLFSILVVNEE